MNAKFVKALYKKEMLDIIRDKKTLIMMILVPLFLYPGMMILSLLVMNSVMKDTLEKVYEVAIYSECGMEEAFYHNLLDSSNDEDALNYHINLYTDYEEGMESLENKKTDVYLVHRMDSENRNYFEVRYKASENTSSTAYGGIKSLLKEYNERLRNELIEEKIGNSDEILNPVLISYIDCSSKEQNIGSFIGQILPIMLITSILMGTIYPAIDATAGERERGTMETMMTLPIKNSELMLGKFLSVSTIAVFSALLNLLSMFGVFLFMYLSLDMSSLGFANLDLSAFIPAMLVLCACLPIFALFCSAVCLCVCLFSKSFKEANNYSTPVLLIFMFGSMAGMIPSIKLSLKTAFIPIVNITLLIKSVFILEYDWKLIAIVFFSTIFYAFTAIIIMSKLFSSEDVLFGESFSSVKFFERRSNMPQKQMPGIGDLVLLFAVLLLVMIYSGSTLVLRFGLYGTAICQLLILLVPVLYAWYMKADFKELFSLRLPKLIVWILAIPSWLGIWLAEQGILALLSKIFPQIAEVSDQLNVNITSSGFWLAFFVVAICPAIAEETAFRGFLFGTLKKRGAVISILVSAVCFGLYHMNLLQFIAGLMVGSVMAYLVYRTGSILPSVIMHLINNGISVIFTFYPEWIQTIPLIGKEELSKSDAVWLTVIGSVILGISILLLEFILKKQSKNEENKEIAKI